MILQLSKFCAFPYFSPANNSQGRGALPAQTYLCQLEDPNATVAWVSSAFAEIRRDSQMAMI